MERGHAPPGRLSAQHLTAAQACSLQTFEFWIGLALASQRKLLVAEWQSADRQQHLYAPVLTRRLLSRNLSSLFYMAEAEQKDPEEDKICYRQKQATRRRDERASERVVMQTEHR
jgi:hypothetical protein